MCKDIPSEWLQMGALSDPALHSATTSGLQKTDVAKRQAQEVVVLPVAELSHGSCYINIMN